MRRHRKPHPRTKREVDQIIRCGDMAIRNYPRWRPAAHLDLMQTEIAPFDPPTRKPYPRTKHEVYRITLQRYDHSRILGYMEPPFWREGEVVVGQR